jgi:hypothetical protein
MLLEGFGLARPSQLVPVALQIWRWRVSLGLQAASI